MNKAFRFAFVTLAVVVITLIASNAVGPWSVRRVLASVYAERVADADPIKEEGV